MENNENQVVEEVKETPDTPTERMYTEKEHLADIQRAVNEYAKKSKERQSKSTDQRILDLEAELARRDNLEATRTSMKAASVPEALEKLFVGEDYEEKIKLFNEWYESAKEGIVKDTISSARPVSIAHSEPNTHKRRTLAEINANLHN